MLVSIFALVHPTVKDTIPHLIVETQYHEGPVVAPGRSGIPKMTIDNVTGCLTLAPFAAAHVAERMLCLYSEEYRKPRVFSRALSLEESTSQQVGDRIAAELTPLIP